MKVKFQYRYGDHIKPGQVVTADKIQRSKNYVSGFKVRIVDIGEKPVWLDLGFFVKPDPKAWKK